ncbi:molybdopterin-guanine dinucleotide biosynthesis protein A [Geomicrobium halophilum]|uniref:Probable molybdenum cofactor guanylyltransferase n=1 Tax=Geomicrobium halophilum TaxID=549000 RepID=A0A841Q1X6_9BACL|nr:molybdenum cofactor guanylyltransferase [Geomicrobium halophilum]MBB6450088.1 molybdopterin-guanine dinucleotide biosynthesis protein A [Geomicrobium halophilum]
MKTAGVILAGGRSSRYGKQKLFEEYNGAPLYQQSITAMTNAGIPSIYIVTNQELACAFNHANVIIEPNAHGGPLSALYTAMEELSSHPFDWLQILAGDLPYMSKDIVQANLRAANSLPSADIILPTAKRYQPLHAAYHMRLLPRLRELIKKESSMKALYETVNTYTLSFSPNHPAFININQPEDWHLKEE